MVENRQIGRFIILYADLNLQWCKVSLIFFLVISLCGIPNWGLEWIVETVLYQNIKDLLREDYYYNELDPHAPLKLET